MGIKNMLTRTGRRAADTVAKLSVLSPEQINDLMSKREKYLSEMPSPNDSSANDLTRRYMAALGIEIYSEYLNHLSDIYAPIEKDSEYVSPFNSAYNIRYFNITKWVTDKKENSIEKLINVYEVLSNEECNIALVFHRSMSGTSVYIAVTNTQNAGSNVDVENYRKRLAEAIRGNFPGAEWTDKEGKGIIPCLRSHIPYSVASASNIPGEKSEKFVSQTIEKLLDGIVPDSIEKEYTIILLATPVNNIEERKLRLARYYTALAPYAGWQTNFTYTESDTATSMATFGLNAGVSAGVQSGANTSISNAHGQTENQARTETDSKGSTATQSQGQTHTDSAGSTVTDSNGITNTDSTSNSMSHGNSYTQSSTNAHTDSTSTSVAQYSGKSDSLGVNASVSGGISLEPAGVGPHVGGSVGANYSHGVHSGITNTSGAAQSDTISNTLAEATSMTNTQSSSHAVANAVTHAVATQTSQAVANSISNSVAQNVGKAVANTLGKAVTNTVTTGAGMFKAVNLGGNFGANFARSSNVSATVGKNEGIQQSFTNYTIKHTLDILESQMKRYEQSTALGMWDFAAYVMSEDQNVASNVAHTYLALTQGEESYLSQTAVNLWRGDIGENSRYAEEICSYLRELRHPLFGLNDALALPKEDNSFYAYPSIVNAATCLSGKELAYSLNFPQRSIAGFPVIECAEFGRNVMTYSHTDIVKPITLGSVFHMNHTENNPVSLEMDSLCSHTFITGSTGSGKSNTVYEILNEVTEQNAHFLVIEPAKGEYKTIFGMNEDVHVYGTNPYMSPMLKVNPFSFPEGVHIFEHLDRLVEIFNVCWPMYAAMPAILKSAVEKSYVDCGWDLMSSLNKYGELLYPTFTDVARNVKEIIDNSEYDSENRGAYKGSLLTRLQSLSNGINGTIFTSDEISAAELFEQNVIVDLSRVGSAETKALIMGMLVLKLQEHRMSNVSGINAGLKHVTVLEEAHNLLRRTSVEQSSETANLLGKSVEMLSNAIAEMRTYGEGFIIVDQSPGLLDMSAIRNTNTKIIMRLPDQGDRELVGRAANLNDDQITELAKLPCGVAAVYQNEWVQPVLCKVDIYEGDFSTYSFKPDKEKLFKNNDEETTTMLLESIMDNELFLKGDKEYLCTLKKKIIESGLSSLVKVDFLDYLASEKKEDLEKLRKLLYDFFNAEEAIQESGKYDDIYSWIESLKENLYPSIKNYTEQQIDLTIMLILQEKMVRDLSYKPVLNAFINVYQKEKCFEKRVFEYR